MIYIIHTELGSIVDIVQSTSGPPSSIPYNHYFISMNTDMSSLPNDITSNYYVDIESQKLSRRVFYDSEIILSANRNILQVDSNMKTAVQNLPEEACELYISGKIYKVEEGSTGFLISPELNNYSDMLITLSGKYKCKNSLLVKCVKIEEAKLLYLESLKAKKKEIEDRGYTTPYGIVATDEYSISRIQLNANRASLSDESFSIDWSMKDKTVVTLNRTEMINMAVLVAEFTDNVHQNKKSIENTINNAAALWQLELIKMNEGWPE